MDLKALKVGDMFLTLETSAKDNLRLGVFHAIEYVLATEEGF